jgi:acetyl esterase/lipase
MRALAGILLVFLLSGCGGFAGRERNATFDPGAVRAVESAAYGEGPRRTLDVYAPAARVPNAPTPNAPVIVFFYGGGWSAGEKSEYAFAGYALAAQGFVTIVPDYRVYPEVRFPEFVDDAALALRWAQDNAARYGGDPHRIVLVGHSAGAHIAMLAALDPHYGAKAGFDPRAVRGVAGLAGPYGFDDFNMPPLRNVFGQVSDPLTAQPIHYVHAGGPSLLLLSGDRDRRVPLRSVTGMAEAANRVGEPVEQKIYPGLDHPGILGALSVSERARAPVLADVTAFARRVTVQSKVVASAGTLAQ